jgi:hypothetical protein
MKFVNQAHRHTVSPTNINTIRRHEHASGLQHDISSIIQCNSLLGPFLITQKIKITSAIKDSELQRFK